MKENLDERYARALHVFHNVLLPYQKDGVKTLYREGSLIEGDDMGLGKTLQTLITLELLKEPGPVLIVAPKFALAVWQDEIRKWLDLEGVIYTGTPKQRANIWNDWLNAPSPFLITNFPMLAEIGSLSGCVHKHMKTPPPGTKPQKVAWKAIVIDEAHMSGVCNYKTKFYKATHAFTRSIPHKFILSGTIVRNGVIDLYGPLSVVDRQAFPSYWSFVKDHCVRMDGPFGMEIERNPANVPKFRQMLRKYYIGRKKEEVLTELPGKRRQKLPVTMSKVQKRMYKELQEELMTLVPDTGEIIITPAMVSVILRQRQLLAAPKLLGSESPSPGIEAIIEHSHLDLDVGGPIVVFTAFRSLLPELAKAFREEYNDVTIYEIKGGMTPDEFGNAWKSFQDGRGRKVLLVVIKSGASFQATVAHTAYFIAPEWDATLNVQAEDRLNRIGQKNFVNIFYVDYQTPVEERVWQLLNAKTETSMFITGTEKEYLKVLRGRQGSK